MMSNSGQRSHIPPSAGGRAGPAPRRAPAVHPGGRGATAGGQVDARRPGGRGSAGPGSLRERRRARAPWPGVDRGPVGGGTPRDRPCRRRPRHRRGPEGRRLVGVGQAPVGRGHPRRARAARGPAGIGAPPRGAGPVREPRRPVRGHPRPALVARGDAGRLRDHPRRVRLLRRLPGSGAAHRRRDPLAPLRPRLRSSRPRSAATCCCSPGWTSRHSCGGCSSSAAGTPGRSSATPRCWASSTTPATRRPSPTTSSCSRVLACSRACPSSRATSSAAGRRAPSSRSSTRRSRPRSPGARSPTRGRTARPGDAWWSRRSVRTWPTPRRPARSSCRGGARGIARSTSSWREPAALPRSRSRAGGPRPAQPGIAAFTAAFGGLGPIRPLLVGGDGIPLERFLLEPAERWVAR